MTKTEPSAGDDLGRAHAALLEDLRQLEEGVHSPLGDGLTKLRASLDATRTHVTKHFEFEEQNGYMDTVRKRDPRFTRTIEHLVEEHRQLSQSLNVLRRQVGEATTLSDALRGEVLNWIKRIRAHEHHENDLVQDAFELDISAED